MKKIIIICIAICCFCSTVFGQKASGYMGKRFSVQAGYGFSVLLNDITTRHGYEDPSLSYYGDTYKSKMFGLSHNFFANLEYAISNYTGFGINMNLHNNIFVMENKTLPVHLDYQGNPMPQYSPVGLHVTSLNPYFKFYRSNIGPAPIGNYISLGFTYSMVKLDSVEFLLDPAHNLYASNGKYNIMDFWFSVGRSCMLGKHLLFSAEIQFPYVIRTLWKFGVNESFSPGNRKVAGSSDFYDLTGMITDKIVMNNWFVYRFGIGIPF